MESTVENAHHRPWGDRRCDLHPTNEFSRIHAILSYRSSSILIVYGMLSGGGLKALESLLALVALLQDETGVPSPLHSHSHHRMGTDSIAPNIGFA